MRTSNRVRFVTGLALAVGTAVAQPVSAENCEFKQDPQEFLTRQERALRDTYERALTFGARKEMRAATGGTRNVAASELRWANVVDDHILGRLEKQSIPVAGLTSDAEFVRRIYLDLIGRLPSPAEYREFMEAPPAGRRDALIDRLLYTPEFTYRWASWLGDLIQNTQRAGNVNQNASGRNAMNDFLRNAIASEKSYRDIAWELVTAGGNNYDDGAANWPLRSITPGGPVQDRYDTMMVRNVTTFLGLSHYDCLACHDGRGRLDQLSVWGRGIARSDAYRLAANFSRLNIVTRPNTANTPYAGVFDISDRATGTYDLNTNYGNRPNRVRLGTAVNITPEYRNGKTPPAGRSWREFFADEMTSDPLFAVNAVNRVWKQLFQLGLAEPVDSLDPARLDPDNPPPAPWAHQTAHPALLKELGSRFTGSNYNLRELIRLMVSSTSYQLSAQYGDGWKLEYVPLFARHYTRRLEPEEIHDNLAQASGNWPSYPITGFAENIRSAWQLPDPTEPAGNQGNGRVFMANFLRGNRDTEPRRQDGSILQQLSLMNDQFVRDRIRTATSPNLRAVAAIPNNRAAVDELFLYYFGRLPSDAESAKSLARLAQATNATQRNQAVEDLAWVLVNRIEFLIAY